MSNLSTGVPTITFSDEAEDSGDEKAQTVSTRAPPARTGSDDSSTDSTDGCHNNGSGAHELKEFLNRATRNQVDRLSLPQSSFKSGFLPSGTGRKNKAGSELDSQWTHYNDSTRAASPESDDDTERDGNVKHNLQDNSHLQVSEPAGKIGTTSSPNLIIPEDKGKGKVGSQEH